MVSDRNVNDKILLLDSSNELDSHLHFNSKFIRTVLKSEPEVDLAMHIGHFTHLNVTQDKVKLVYSNFNKNNSIRKQLLNGIKIAWIIRKYQRVIILSLERYSFLSLLVFTYLRDFSIRKIVIIHHAWLSQLKYSKLIKFSVIRSMKRFRNIVLGNWIIETLESFGIKGAELIPHPMSLCLENDKNNIKKNSFRIGYLGNAHENKGFDVFARLASNFRSNVDREFIVIGKRVDYINKCERANNIKFNCIEVPSNHHFLAELIKCDLVVFPFPFDRYELYCSGVVFDCISQKVPFIFLKGNIMLNYLHTKFNLGVEMNDFESLCRYIDNLNSTVVSKIRDQYNDADHLFELNGFTKKVNNIFND